MSHFQRGGPQRGRSHRGGSQSSYRAVPQRGVQSSYRGAFYSRNRGLTHVPPERLPRCSKTDCKRVGVGKCSGHPECQYGVKCRFLIRRTCRYYHPLDQFEATGGLLRLPHSSFTIQPNSIPKPSRPSRHHERWTKKEDAVLLKFIQNHPFSYCKRPQIAEIEKKLQRSKGAIETRLRYIATQHPPIALRTSTTTTSTNDQTENANLESTASGSTPWRGHRSWTHTESPKESDNDDSSDSDSSDSSDESEHRGHRPGNTTNSNTNNNNNGNTPLKQRAIRVFDALCRYYQSDHNQFDYRSSENALNALRKCSGSEQEVMSITLNPLSFFEKKVTEFEAKYGRIDFELERTIIRKMEFTKTLLLRTVQHIDTAIEGVKGKMCLGRESEFKELSGGYDLEYFSNIVSSVNAPKCSVVPKLPSPNAARSPTAVTAPTAVRRAVRRPESPGATVNNGTAAITVKSEAQGGTGTKPPPPMLEKTVESERGSTGQAMKQEPPDDSWRGNGGMQSTTNHCNTNGIHEHNKHKMSRI